MTGGRSVPDRRHFDHVTLVTPTVSGVLPIGLTPEQRRVLDLCRAGALSVAEIAGHLQLPLSVVRVLLADLLEAGHITTRATHLSARRPDRKLLEAVLAGLRAL
jgi:DNA-binding MarR family transcriptional regulator